METRLSNIFRTTNVTNLTKVIHESCYRVLQVTSYITSSSSSFLPSFHQFLLKGMLTFAHKMVFIENEAALLCVTMRERARTFAATI